MTSDVVSLDGLAARAALCLDAMLWGHAPDERVRGERGLVEALHFEDVMVTLAARDEGAVPFVVDVAVGGRHQRVDVNALSLATTHRSFARGDLRPRFHLPLIG